MAKRGLGGNSQTQLVPQGDGNQTEAVWDKDSAILNEAKRRFKRAMDWEKDFLHLYDEDTKFANADSDNGWQWPENIKQERDFQNRPCLTINKTKMHVLLLANEARQAPPQAKVKPVGGEVSYEAAEVWEGLLRHIEYISDAQSVYTQAKESQLEGGMGYWQIQPDYEDDRSFNQELRIAPLNTKNVVLDCDIKRVDGSDALWGFIFDMYDRHEFADLFPNVQLPPARSPGLADNDDWIRRDSVRVAQYYRIRLDEETLIYVEDANGDSWTGLKKDIPASFREQLPLYERGELGDYKERKVMERTLQWFKIAGNEIIDRRDGSARDKPNLKGRYVPIVRLPGRERVIQGRLYRAGLVRGLKDAQRMYNYNHGSLDTKVPTPSGWTTIGEVKEGDLVFNEKGQPCKVIGMSPVHIGLKCYRVEFDDGSSIITSYCHEWTVEERGKRKAATWDWSTKTISTEQMVPGKHFIWATEPLDLPEADLPIDPYILGAWLGDGYSANASICSGLADMDEMEKILRASRHFVGERKIYKNAHTASWTIFGIREELKALGVLNNKHIPAIYLRASRTQREALLQGLMDTDGHFSKHTRQNVFVNVNPNLADGFAELVRSLGLKATYTKMAAGLRKFPSGKVYQTQEAFRFSFSSPPGRQVYRLPRKADAHNAPRVYHPRRTGRHRIVSVTEVPSVPVKCLMVDTPSHLFLWGDSMVPTHNTSGEVEVVALQTKTPWIIAAEAIEGNEAAWANANVTNAAYLTFRAIADDGETSLPKPERMQPPQAAQGFLEGLRIAAAEMEMASGQYQSQFENQSIERTPAAVNRRNRMGELANYDFTYNEMQAVRHTAVLILDLAPHYYDTERVINIRAEDNTISEIMIDPKMAEAHRVMEAQNPNDPVKIAFNPKVGKYAVEASVGPRYQTQREEFYEAFKELVGSSPEILNIIGDLGFLAADWPMANKIAERFKRNIKANSPWLLEDNQGGPAFAKMQEQLQAAQGQIGDLMTKLAEARIAKRGKDELRDIEVFDAETRRLTAEASAAEGMIKIREGGILARLVEEQLARLLGFSLADVERANKANIEENAPASEGANGASAGGA